MNQNPPTVDDFIAQISVIENALNSLENHARAIAEQHQTPSFHEHGTLHAALENIGMAMTHETASQIGFYREQFMKLIRFIEFRQVHAQFSDAELEGILDGSLTLTQKRQLAKKCDGVSILPKLISAIQTEWRSLFGNTDYTKIKKQLFISNLPALPHDVLRLWTIYVDAEANRLRQETMPALEHFIRALNSQPRAEVDAWAMAFSRANNAGAESIPTRPLLFREIIFPALFSGYTKNDPECIWLLSTFSQLLYKSPECQQQLAELEQSEYGLLLKLYRIDPSNIKVRERLIEIISDDFAYRLHELPAGVLYGHNGASIAECAEMLQELNFFAELIRGTERPDWEQQASDARYYISAYQHYLTSRKSGDTFEQYLQSTKSVPVTIVRYVDDNFPGWVECELVDAAGERHLFREKIPVISTENFAPDTIYPQTGSIACEIVATWIDTKATSDRCLTRINTTRPWGIESTMGETEFIVPADTIVTLPH